MKYLPGLSSKSAIVLMRNTAWASYPVDVNEIANIFFKRSRNDSRVAAGRQCIAYTGDINRTASALLPFRRVTTATRGYSNGGYFFKNG